MPMKLATISAAILSLALLSGCGEESGTQSSTDNLDGAAEQPSLATEQPGATEEATGEQPATQ